MTYYSEVAPKRELADWLSPAWFCFAVGDSLAAPLDYDSPDTVWIQIENSDEIGRFIHSCWGRSSDPGCSADGWELGSKDPSLYEV